MRLIYHPGDELELIKAARFYENRLLTLGRQFLDIADEAVTRIQTSPERFRVVEDEVRCLIMNRFPYSIYCRLSSDEIRILAVMHQSRHPDYWRGRLVK